MSASAPVKAFNILAWSVSVTATLVPAVVKSGSYNAKATLTVFCKPVVVLPEPASCKFEFVFN